MDTAKLGLLTTLLLGIFIIIGALIAFLIKKKERVVDFSLGLAFSVIIMLILSHMLPETIELLGLKHIYLFIIFTVVGYMILKLLDNFIPDHDDDGKGMDNHELRENLIHIGVITSIALVLHNIIEGMAVYSTVLSDASLGLAVTIGIGFHNIPLGMVIASTFYKANNNSKKTWRFKNAFFQHPIFVLLPAGGGAAVFPGTPEAEEYNPSAVQPGILRLG